MQETVDFENECKALEALLIKLKDHDYNTETQFKTWTIFDILAHLHLWNMAAIWTLNEPHKFDQLMVEVIKVFQGGQTHQKLQKEINCHFDHHRHNDYCCGSRLQLFQTLHQKAPTV